MYTGDERGTIVAYNFKQVIGQVQLYEYKSNHFESVNFSPQKSQLMTKDHVQVIWKNKEHSESVRHLLFHRIFNQSLLVSTSFDRKIKIWSALTGEFIDSLRKGNTEEA